MESKPKLSASRHPDRSVLDVVASRRQFLIATAGGAAGAGMAIVGMPCGTPIRPPMASWL